MRIFKSVKTFEEMQSLINKGFKLDSMSYWISTPDSFRYNMSKIID